MVKCKLSGFFSLASWWLIFIRKAVVKQCLSMVSLSNSNIFSGIQPNINTWISLCDLHLGHLVCERFIMYSDHYQCKLEYNESNN